jgi:acetate kinase
LLGRPHVAERARRLYIDGPGRFAEEKPNLRVISCHLGGSSSITGILNGVAIGNSLGMSPQSGLPHNNRVGDLDPFALPYMMRTQGTSLDEAERQLCKESGLKALSGGYNDLRDIQAQATDGNACAQLALDVLVHQTRHWIGAYFLQLNGADALVFTAGIGENQHGLRQLICASLDQLGIALDPALNGATQAKEALISAPESRVKVMVIPTNEELVVAREVTRFLNKS